MTDKKIIEQKTLPGFRDFLPEDLRSLGKIAVAIDAANLERSVKDGGWRIDFKKLKRGLESLGLVVSLNYYTVESETLSQKDFLKSITRFGYEVVSKPVKTIRAKNGATLRKANFDVEITADACLNLAKFDSLILFSGDSDFAYLVSLVRKRDKKVVIISMQYHISKELISAGNFYIDLRKLKESLERPQKSPAFAQGAKNNLSTAGISILARRKHVKP